MMIRTQQKIKSSDPASNSYTIHNSDQAEITKTKKKQKKVRNFNMFLIYNKLLHI